MINKVKNLANRLLANKAIRGIYTLVNRATLAIGGSSRVGATLYSIPGFLTHNREQYAVLSGRRAYFKNLKKSRPSHVELRRNVHRIEKGLSMQPRRASFASNYIVETVEYYERAYRSHDAECIDSAEIVWAHDVLTEYFAVADPVHPAIAEAKTRFTALPAIKSNGTAKPYTAGSRPEAKISYEDFLGLAMRRRSVRWFEDRPVPRELIDKALIAARQAPTACNRLPYEFLVFEDPDDIRKVGSIPAGASGYYQQIPALIVVKGDLSAYFSARDRHAIYVDASLAAMSFLFAIETLGLSGSVINWPDFEPLEAKMQRRLRLKPYERVVMLMAVGYADPEGVIPFSQKKGLEVLRRYSSLG